MGEISYNYYWLIDKNEGGYGHFGNVEMGNEQFISWQLGKQKYINGSVFEGWTCRIWVTSLHFDDSSITE